MWFLWGQVKHNPHNVSVLETSQRCYICSVVTIFQQRYQQMISFISFSILPIKLPNSPFNWYCHLHLMISGTELGRTNKHSSYNASNDRQCSLCSTLNFQLLNHVNTSLTQFPGVVMAILKWRKHVWTLAPRAVLTKPCKSYTKYSFLYSWT